MLHRQKLIVQYFKTTCKNSNFVTYHMYINLQYISL